MKRRRTLLISCKYIHYINWHIKFHSFTSSFVQSLLPNYSDYSTEMTKNLQHQTSVSADKLYIRSSVCNDDN